MISAVNPSKNAFDPSSLYVDVKLVNNSGAEFHCDASDFALVPRSGQIIDSSLSASEYQMDGGALAPGGNVEGNIAFVTFVDEGGLPLDWG